jgi:hypothetical protein
MTTDTLTKILKAKPIAKRLNLNLDEAEKVLDLAETLSPLDIKPEMYKPMLRSKDALSYEVAAQNVALKKLRSKKQ